MGQITNDAASVFSQKLVDDLMTRPAWQLATPPKYIFLGVDPNGGGSSDLAIITCCFENNNLIFCGCETYPAKVSNIKPFFLSFFSNIIIESRSN